LYLTSIRQIARDCQDLAAVLFQFASRSLQFFGIPSADSDPGSLLDHLTCQDQPQPSGSPGNQYDLATKIVTRP